MGIEKTFAIMGGDMRQVYLAAFLLKKGYKVRSYGLPRAVLPKGVQPVEGIKALVEGVCALLLPVPAFTSAGTVSVPLSPDVKAPQGVEIIESMGRGGLIAGGKFSKSLQSAAEKRGIFLFDYLTSNRWQEKNAVPTAEGAVFILMRERKETINGLSVAVTGWGRVGKALANLLCAMGARVSVAARNPVAREEAEKAGCAAFPITPESLATLAESNAVLCNTVPAKIFDREVLKSIPEGVLLLDLASAPGGVDKDEADLLGVRTIWALSLPGKYAPQTAGDIIGEAVLEELRREGKE